MGWRIAEHLIPLLGAALVVAVVMGFLLYPFFAPAGGRKAARQPAPAASPRSPVPAQATSPPPAPRPTRVPPPTPTRSPTPAPEPPPLRLVLPAAQVNAAVETVGLDPQGVIDVPSRPMDAAWYDGSPAPGEPGNAIVDGHLDWWTGPGVFGHLSQVRVGDQLAFIHANGSEVTFTVTGEQVFGANAQIPAGMLVKSGPATVSLITCTGAWDAGQAEYQQRLVVNARLN